MQTRSPGESQMPVSTPALTKESVGSAQQSRRSPVLLAGIITVAAALFVQLYWFSLDNRVPSMDEAGHILNGMQYADLLHHFRPWKADWLHQFLSINPFYPPAVYIFDGALKLVFGAHRVSDIICFMSYLTILLGAVYGITWKLTKSLRASAFAAAVLYFYPQIQHLSHVYMLDLPLVAMVAAGLFALMWWQENPNWKRTVATGIVVSLACFTKQLGAAYLLPACVYLLITVNPRAKLSLVWVGIITSAIMLPWLIVNLAWIKQYAAENAVHMVGAQTPLWRVFADYLVGLVPSMSIPLAGAFFVALIPAMKEQRSNLAMLAISAVGGIAFTSLLSCTFPLDRYAAPALVVMAVITAIGTLSMFKAQRKFGGALAIAIIAVGVSQMLAFSFAPRPITTPWTQAVTTACGTGLREFRGEKILRSYPHDDSGWAHQAILATIDKRDPHIPVWLNILPSSSYYNPHSFDLLAHEQGLAIKPTTSRRWTIMGDTVEFSPESALWFQWYLLKTGSQGNQFKNKQSEMNYNDLTRYVTESGKFECITSFVVPDGSTASLWRQR